jgi:hypothetical protein
MRSPAGREEVVETAGTRRVQAGSLAWLAETGVDTSAAGLLAAELAGAAQTTVASACCWASPMPCAPTARTASPGCAGSG